MSIHDSWSKALKETEIIRSRVQSLKTFGDTHVPYILLSESAINLGDTVVRKGEVVVAKPALILPPDHPQLDGFDLENYSAFDENALINFLLVRGIHLPSLRYNNTTSSLDIFEGGLSKAVDRYHQELQQAENVQTGLIAGPEDCWQFSILLFICSQIIKNADADIRNLLEHNKRKSSDNA